MYKRYIGDGAYAPSPNSARSISVGGDSGVPSGADDARGVVVVARRRAARREEEEDDDDGAGLSGGRLRG